MKPIPNCDGYFASNLGNIYSNKSGELIKLKPYLDTKGNYLNITLMINCKRKICIVHRLIAMTFIPNPDNLPEVDHKDKDKLNNKAENLRWCTRKDNLNHSYSTMSPTRNFRKAKLYNKEQLIGEFKGIAKAARYAHNKFGVSESALAKYLKCGDFNIKAETDGNYSYKNHTQTKTYNKSKIKLYKNGYFQKEFKTIPELTNYLNKILNENVNDRTLHYHLKSQTEYKGYLIKRVG